MQRKKLDLGNSDFKNLMVNDNYYVDKSMFIHDILNAEKQVMLLPRPRRFGKTLNLSMLRYFFDANMPENKNLFKNLAIWQKQDEIEKHCCKYPVIYLSFKDAKANTWDDCFELIVFEIVKLFKQHRYLLKDNLLFEDEKNEYQKIINKTASSVDYQNSLKLLSEYLNRYNNQKLVILIDEYDTPIQSGYDKYYDEIVPFMRNLLSGAFKDNSYLFKGVITGILRVSKESIFSGLNNLGVYSILDSRFSDKFGFTEHEVEQILKDFNLSEKYKSVKDWYNGYKFAQSENIYNPWSILSYVSDYKDGFKPFWSNTSANDLIKKEIQKKDATNIRAEIIKLANNETVVKDLETNFVFPDLELNKDLLWTLLVYSGYLTIKCKISRKEYELEIPNYEVKTVFLDTILEWLKIDVKLQKILLQETANNLTHNKITKFEKGFRKIMGDTFSYYDTAKINEYVYHSYLLGLLAIIGDDYIIKSNRESGDGRYDIMLIPHDKTKFGVVIEIKQIEKQSEKENNKTFTERINKNIKTALNQINKNKYYKELIDNKIKPEKIITVPIVFAGKEPYVTMIEK